MLNYYPPGSGPYLEREAREDRCRFVVEKHVERIIDNIDKEFPDGSAMVDHLRAWDALDVLFGPLADDEDDDSGEVLRAMKPSKAFKLMADKFDMFEFLVDFERNSLEDGFDGPKIMDYRFRG